MKKNFERFGYVGTVVDNLLTIKNPLGIVVKQSEYTNFTCAVRAWYNYCKYHDLKIRPRTQDTVVIDINIPDPEEPIQSIEKPIPTIQQKIANNLPLTAIIDFNFVNEFNLSLPEWINTINDRIKLGEYRPSEIVRIRLVPNN